MLNRLKQMKLHYEQLSEKIASPEVMADMNAWRELVKEHSTLEPIITAYDEYLETERGIADCRAMLDSEETEQEMRTLAEEELAELSHKAAQQQENLKILLLPKDKNDERNVIMEIRAGTGGDEAALFGAVLMRMYQRYAERHNFKYELIDIAETEMGGIKEATFSLNGRRCIFPNEIRERSAQGSASARNGDSGADPHKRGNGCGASRGGGY